MAGSGIADPKVYEKTKRPLSGSNVCFARDCAMTAWGRFPPVSGFLFGIGLIGLGLSSNLTFMTWTGPDSGSDAYGGDRPIQDIFDFAENVSVFVIEDTRPCLFLGDNNHCTKSEIQHHRAVNLNYGYW